MTQFRFSIARAAFARSALLLARAAVFFGVLSLASTLASAAATLVPSQFVGGAPVDSDVLGHRIPLVLVHGLSSGPEAWEAFLRAYEQNPAWRRSFKPYSFGYISSATEINADPAAPRSIHELGGAFRDTLQNLYDKPLAAPDFGIGASRVVILAHSMGGLVARSMMQEYAFRDGQRGGQKVLHLITLGTAHQGSPLADAAIILGHSIVNEFDDGYFGFVHDLTWTNFDRLNMLAGKCNPWLAQLNNYAPATGGNYGNCGTVTANPLPGYYDKIIAYGASDIQDADARTGAIGVYKPGSENGVIAGHSYLTSGIVGRSYSNDGLVPMVSAQFSGPTLWSRREAFSCDHRYIMKGYPEFVVTAASTYTDWAFCAGTNSGASYASGSASGYAVSGSILGAPGGIIDTIETVSDVERVFNWAEGAYAAYLQPAGATTDIWNGYYYRWYPQTQSYAGVKDGSVWYMGPASNGEILWIAPLPDMAARAQDAGF